MVTVVSGDQKPRRHRVPMTYTHTHSKSPRSQTPPVREIVLVADLTGLDAENCGTAAVNFRCPKLAGVSPTAKSVRCGARRGEVMTCQLRTDGIARIGYFRYTIRCQGVWSMAQIHPVLTGHPDRSRDSWMHWAGKARRNPDNMLDAVANRTTGRRGAGAGMAGSGLRGGSADAAGPERRRPGRAGRFRSIPTWSELFGNWPSRHSPRDMVVGLTRRTALRHIRDGIEAAGLDEESPGTGMQKSWRSQPPPQRGPALAGGGSGSAERGKPVVGPC